MLLQLRNLDKQASRPADRVAGDPCMIVSIALPDVYLIRNKENFFYIQKGEIGVRFHRAPRTYIARYTR